MKSFALAFLALIGALITMSACFFFGFTLWSNQHPTETFVAGGFMLYFWFYTAYAIDSTEKLWKQRCAAAFENGKREDKLEARRETQ